MSDYFSDSLLGLTEFTSG